jgi:hypothetical protein
LATPSTDHIAFLTWLVTKGGEAVMSSHIDGEPSIVELMSAIQSVILTITRRMQLIENQTSWPAMLSYPDLCMATIRLEGLLIGLIECDDGAVGGVEFV